MVTSCRFCGHALGAPFIDLGHQPLANAYVVPGTEAAERTFPLVVRTCSACLLVQADHSVPADQIFTTDYAYFSSYATSWVAHAERYAAAMTARFNLGQASQVVEVASNDGYLLQHFARASVPVLGVEPTRRTAEAAIAKGISTEIAFFGQETAARLADVYPRADLMVANNVLAHVPDIADFVQGFAVLLNAEGVATFEFPHLLNLIEHVQFDTIYHEHYSYLSLAALEKIFAHAGLRVFDVEQLPTHGGSLRLFVCHTAAAHGACDGLHNVRALEHARGLDRADGAAYLGFPPRVAAARRSFCDFLAGAKAEQKTVAGYGAAAKGNTFLNYCGVHAPDLLVVADASHAKQGRLLPGSHIPVVAPNALSDLKPDYIVILPWNLAPEITRTMQHVREWGGQFVIAIPETQLLP